MALQKPSFDYEAIAGVHDQKARKDATLNMRLSSEQLNQIKAAAEAAGYSKYQQWVQLVLADAVAQALNIQNEGDDF